MVVTHSIIHTTVHQVATDNETVPGGMSSITSFNGSALSNQLLNTRSDVPWYRDTIAEPGTHPLPWVPTLVMSDVV
jgi:hypothetical protein